MPNNPKSIGGHFEAIIGGWEEHAADATFGGLTLTQYKTKVKSSFDARDVIEDLERKLDAARVDRKNSGRREQRTYGQCGELDQRGSEPWREQSVVRVFRLHPQR